MQLALRPAVSWETQVNVRVSEQTSWRWERGNLVCCAPLRAWSLSCCGCWQCMLLDDILLSDGSSLTAQWSWTGVYSSSMLLDGILLSYGSPLAAQWSCAAKCWGQLGASKQICLAMMTVEPS